MNKKRDLEKERKELINVMKKNVSEDMIESVEVLNKMSMDSSYFKIKITAEGTNFAK